MNKLLLRKYAAVKIAGFDHFVWFVTENISINEITFTGKSGWGKGGAFTNIECKVHEISSIIYSDELQYS